MAQLERTGRSLAIKGVGYARRGVVQTVPDEMVEELLATGDWARPGEAIGASDQPVVQDPVDAPDSLETEDDSDDESEEDESEDESEEADEDDSETEPDRVTEPAPSKPARRSRRKGK